MAMGAVFSYMLSRLARGHGCCDIKFRGDGGILALEHIPM